MRHLIVVVVLALAQTTDAQTRTPASTATSPAASASESVEALKSKIAQLEQQLAGMQRDFTLVLTNCQMLATAAQPASPIPSPGPTPVPSGQLDDGTGWFVKSVLFGVTETTNYYTRFGWSVTINNGGGSRPRQFDVAVQFLNERGLVVDTDRNYGVVVPAFGEETIRGSALLRNASAATVRTAHAVATPTR